VFIIYHPKCLRCNFLSEHGKFLYEDCHYTKGNTNCPASETRIVVGVNVNLTAKRMVEAINTGNTELLAKINSRIANKDPIIIKQVMDEVKRLMATPA